LNVWERIGSFAIRRARTTLVAVGLATAFFATFLADLRIDTSFLSFVRPETRVLVDRLEGDFGEGAYLTLIFEARGGRSLLEPALLKHQLRVMRAIEAEHPVTTASLVEGIDQGLLRVKRLSLFDVDDYSTVAEAILGLAGGRTVRDLMKVSAHWMSDPEAIAFYANLRIAQSAGLLAAPGAPDSRYRVPRVEAIRALVRAEPTDSRAERRARFAAIRDQVDALATPELAIHVLSDELVAHDIDRDTQRSAVLLGLVVFGVDVLCVFALFRSRREVAIVFTILAVAAVFTFGIAALLGIELSFLHLLVFPILLGTGIDDSLVFGCRLEEEARAGGGVEATLRRTYAGCGNAIFLTTATTFVAFLATGLTSVADVFASFFLLVSLSMAVVFLLTMLLQGAVRSLLAARDADGKPVAAATSADSPLAAVNRILVRRVRRIVRAGPRGVIVVGVAVLVLSALSALRIDSEMGRGDLLQPAMPSHAANAALQRHFGDFRIGYVWLGGDVARGEVLVALKALEREMTAIDEVERVLGTANVDSVVGLVERLGLRITPSLDVPSAFDRLRASDRIVDHAIHLRFSEAFDHVVHRRADPSGPVYDGLLLRFFVTGEESSRSLAAVAAIERAVSEVGLDRLPGVEVRVGGGDVIYPLESTYYVETLARSFGWALAGNLIVLLAAWRRPGKALLASVPVIVAATIVIGLLPVFGVPLNALNLGISAILVGIGIDYPIHWIERYDEERRRHGRSPREAARTALDEMGPHLLAGMLTTSIGFCAATVLLLPMSTSFGLTMGFAIVLVYVVTMVVLPVLVVAGESRAEPPSPDP